MASSIAGPTRRLCHPRASALTDEHKSLIEDLGMYVARIATPDSPDEGSVVDLTGDIAAWLGTLKAAAAIVRPDYYLFGAVASMDELPELVEDLGRQTTGLREASRG